MMIDVNEFTRAISSRGNGHKFDIASILGQLAHSVRHSVRSSDVVSGVEKNKMGILLVETSQAGVEKVQKRIGAFIRDFLKGEMALPFEPKVEIRTASYPEESEGLTGLASMFSGDFQAATSN